MEAVGSARRRAGGERGLPARLCCGFVLACAVLPVAPPTRLLAQTSLTIYNDGRVLARRTLALALPKGTSEQRLELGTMEPGSLFSLDPDVAIVGSAYDGAVDEASAMRRAIGRQVLFRTSPTDTVTATVVGVDPERFRLADGRMLFARPGQPVFPADIAPPDPVTRAAVRADGARKDLRVGYFTGGAQWSSAYQVVLARGQARVAGAAVINSQALHAENAEVQLLAGAVNRAGPEQPPAPKMMRADAMAVAGAPAAEASEQRVGEFHLYSLPGRTTILPGTTTSVALFAPATAPAERAYVVRGQLPYWGFIPQQGDETQVPVQVIYTLKRARKTELGERPLPAGTARVFEADSAGRLQLIGEAAVGHTPAGEDIRLDAGSAFDLTARRTQTSYATRRDSSKAGVRTVVTADYAVALTNATDSAATVEVREERAGEWSVLSSSVPAEKVSSTVTRFRVPVPARGQARLTYRIQAIW
jgi:hypothetical protein